MKTTTADFRVFESKWGPDQLFGTTGGLISYSFAISNVVNQRQDFDSFITDESFQQEIVESLAAWEQVADVRFTRAPDSEDVGIRFGWRDIDGAGGVLGQTALPSNGPLARVSVVFDRDENWFVGGDSSADRIDFSSTALHEIGHAIGIDHSQDPSALMAASYSTTNFELQGDDINAAATIYGANDLVVVDIHRFFNPSKGGHFFTADVVEKESVEALNLFDSEGVGFRAFSKADEQGQNTIPIYRFLNTDLGSHLFTAFELEKASLMSSEVFVFEGVSFRALSIDTAETIPVYRFFNTANGGHFFTTNEIEKNAVLSIPQFIYEGEAFYTLAV